MIEVNEAVKIAKNFVKDLFQDEEIFNVSLEEVNFNDDSDNWIVTIGYDLVRKKAISPIHGVLSIVQTDNTEQIREYKTVTLDADDGSFKGMNIRQFSL